METWRWGVSLGFPHRPQARAGHDPDRRSGPDLLLASAAFCASPRQHPPPPRLPRISNIASRPIEQTLASPVDRASAGSPALGTTHYATVPDLILNEPPLTKRLRPPSTNPHISRWLLVLCRVAFAPAVFSDSLRMPVVSRRRTPCVLRTMATTTTLPVGISSASSPVRST